MERAARRSPGRCHERNSRECCDLRWRKDTPGQRISRGHQLVENGRWGVVREVAGGVRISLAVALVMAQYGRWNDEGSQR